MRNLLLTLRFDGTEYHGWQVQQNAVSVQQVFQDGVERLFGTRLNVVGCSRTDTGVHANMYCCNMKTDSAIPCDCIIRGLNTYLPKDIAVIGCREVPEAFHARYSCKSKEYIYKLYNGAVRDPFFERYAQYQRSPIDTEMLNREAQAFIGTFDYSGFSSTGGKVKDTVRTVHAFSVWRENDVVCFKVEADGFLYNMVRIMIGTLLFISQGKIEEGALREIILSKDRTRAGKTAPAKGLYLNQVNY